MGRSQPPETAVTALQGLVSQLRRLLEDDDAIRDGNWNVLVGGGSGYGITVPAGAIDAQRFLAHVETARDARELGDHAAALSAIDAALALWRGRPLLGLETPDIGAFTERCESARLDALEDRADALLGLGRPREALADVDPLIEANPAARAPARGAGGRPLPLRTPGRRSGGARERAPPAARRTRARTLPAARRPGAATSSTTTRRSGPPTAPADAPRRRRSRAALGRRRPGRVPAIAAGAIALSTGQSNPPAGGAAAGDQAVAIDAASGEIRASYAVGAGAVGLTSGDGAVWTLNADDSTVTRIDLARRSTRTFGTGTTPIDLAAGAGALWVADGSRTGSQFVGPVVTAVSKLVPADGSVLVSTGLERSRALTSNTSRQHIVATPGRSSLSAPTSRSRDSTRVAAASRHTARR